MIGWIKSIQFIGMDGPGGGPSPFDPLTIPSLRVWIDPADSSTKFQDAAGTTPVTTQGQPIGRISDKSGNGNHFTQTADATRPVASFLSGISPQVAAIGFNGSSVMLRSDTLAALFNGASPKWTAHVVYDTLTVSARAVFAAGRSTSTDTYTWLQSRSVGGKFTLETRRGAASATSAVGSDVTLTTQVVSIRHNGSTVDFWRNGVRVGTAIPVATETVTTFDRFSLGALTRSTFSAYHSGNIGEFIMSGEANSDADVERAHEYLINNLGVSRQPADVFVVTGQSNAEGRGTSGPTVTSGAAVYVSGASLSPLADPVGGANTGSAWPAFANAWKSLTGHTSAWVEQATGGSGLIDGVGAANWSPAGTLRAAAVSAANTAITTVRNSLQYSVGNVYVCWQQGEQDATEYNGTTISASTYQPAQEELFDYFFANINSLGAILVSELGEHVTTNPNYSLIRGAQNAAVSDTPNCHLVFTGAKDFPAQGKMKADGVHYNQSGLDDMGAGMATGAASVV